MSVINFGARELGNVLTFILEESWRPAEEERHVAGLLATVSQANGAEFLETYSTRHGQPEVSDAEDIIFARPDRSDPERALSTLNLLSYNAQTRDAELRAKATEALTSLLTRALRRATKVQA